MKNADRPMSPVEVSGYGKGNITGLQTSNYSRWEIGLTKREHFAGLAMQAVISTVNNPDTNSLLETPKNTAQWAVKFADELLKALEDENF